MKTSWRNSVSVLLFTPIGISLSQVGEQKFIPHIRVEFAVPNSISNNAFKKSFTGILEAGLSGGINFRSYNGGLFYRYTEFQIQGKKISGLSVIQRWHTAGIRIGYDKHINNKFVLTPSLNLGYNRINYTQVVCATTQPDSEAGATSIQTNIAGNFIIGDGFAIGGILGLSITDYVFDPNVICLNEHKSYSDSNKHGATISFSFGFSVYVELKKRQHEGDY